MANQPSNDKDITFPWNFLNTRNLFIVICLIIGFLNVRETLQEFLKHRQNPRNQFSNFPGYKFMGLDEVFKNETYIGYYTDRDLAQRTAVAQYSQAQYVLAPRILSVDLDKIPYNYVLLDCSDRDKAVQKMKELNLVAVKENNLGIILARKSQ